MNGPDPQARQASVVKHKARKLLFFTRILPGSGHSGCATYSHALLRHLKRERGCKIDIIWTQPADIYKFRFFNLLPADTGELGAVRIPGRLVVGRCVFYPGVWYLPLKARLFNKVKQFLSLFGPAKTFVQKTPVVSESPVPEQVSRSLEWDSPATTVELDYLRKRIGCFAADVVLFNYPWMMEGAVSLLPERTRSWVLTHDYRFRRCVLDPVRGYEVVWRRDERWAQEMAVLAQADLVLAIQDAEREAYGKSLPGTKVITAGMPVSKMLTPLASSTLRCGFVGSGNMANINAATWFIQSVWPLVHRSRPGLEFHLAGGVCEGLRSLELPAGVRLAGRVASVESFYNDCGVAVVPLLEGSGIKIKLIEAIASGCACVTTSVGLDGLEFVAEALLVADTPEAFADAVLALIGDPTLSQTKAVKAQKLLFERLSEQACFRELNSRIE